MRRNKQKPFWFTEINKSPTVSNGVRTSSFEILTANLAQSFTVGTLKKTHGASSLEIQTGNFAKSVTLPCRYPKIWHSDVLISDLGIIIFMLLFLREKNQNVLDTQEHCIHKLGKIRSELKLVLSLFLIFKDMSWHSYFPSHGIL